MAPSTFKHKLATAAMTLLAGGLLAQPSYAQSPPETMPMVNESLSVTYNTTNGTVPVSAGMMFPIADVARQPDVVYSNATANASYMVLLIDLSLPASRFPADQQATLVPGLGANRTTRLHWWQTDLSLASNGSLVLGGGNDSSSMSMNATVGPAVYGGPQPPEGDIPHYYTFYLFEQPENFTLPMLAANGSYLDGGAAARVNFSVDPIVEQAGQPIAATYFITAANTTMISGGDNATQTSAMPALSTSASTGLPLTGAATTALTTA